MKKQKSILVALLTSISLILAACSGDEEVTQDNKSNQVDTESQDRKNSNKFEEVGDKKETEDATYEILKKKTIDQTIDVSPIKVTIKGIALIKMTNIEEDNGGFLSQYTSDGSVPTTANYLQIDYVYENTNEKDITFYGLDKIVLNNGEQLDAVGNDFIWENNESSDFYGKVKQDGSIGLIVNGDPKEINIIKIITSSSEDAESYETITEPQRLELSFE